MPARAGFTSYPATAYLLTLGLALGPQLLGHTALNWSLRHLSPAFVAVATLGEPIGRRCWRCCSSARGSCRCSWPALWCCWWGSRWLHVASALSDVIRP
ncbi:MAG: hypothetical protein U0Z44_18805 [Kouleothrix sp.]